MSPSPHKLLLASAGTGKTYQLTSHFLGLLLRGVPPERILATTFTRKAAGEILDRVLARLLDAAQGEGLDALSEAAGRRLTAEEAAGALVRAARAIDRFEVRTLDSFFVRVARLFALEVGLPPGWTIVDEIADRDLQAEGVAAVLAEGSRDERLELLREVHRAAGSRRVHEEMSAVVASGRALLLESTRAAWEWDPGLEPLGEEALASAIEALAAAAVPADAKGAPKKRWTSAIADSVECARAQDWEAFVGKGLAKKILAGESTFHGAEIPGSLRAPMEAILRHIAARDAAAIARRSRAARRVLERFEASYVARKRAGGGYRFDDLPYAIAPLGGAALLGTRRDDVWLRLDGRIDHLLLDEFQDTAPAQWRALAPLADEILADGTGERSFFCVGDPKQSIYGWRQAEPRMLGALGETYRDHLERVPLDRSYRSSPVVLAAVNRVFGGLPGLRFFAEGGSEAARMAAQRFSAAFREHESHFEGLPGAVAAYRAARRENGDGADALVVLAAQRVADLRQEAPGAEIGVLVRTNKRIPPLLDALQRNGVRASGEGGNPLTDAESVQVFLSALHLADHPGDTAAAFHVETSPLAGALGLASAADPAAREGAARILRERLLAEGYGPVAADLLPAVARVESWSAWDRRRFGQLVELAYAFDARAGLRPSEFVRLLRETRVEDPTAAPVRVMTVHAAKGLEFDAVVLAELDAGVGGRTADFVWHRGRPLGEIDRVAVAPPARVERFVVPLRELAEAHRARDAEESICALYVAMTRARRRLELLLPPPNKSGRSTAKSYANLLAEALDMGEPDATGLVWEQPKSTSAWAQDLAAPAAPPAPRAAVGLELPARATPRELPRRTPSGEEGGAPTARDLLRDRRAASLGTLVHRWLETLTWLEEFEPQDDAELLALARTVEPDETLRRAALAFLRDALRREPVRAELARPPDPEHWRVETELPFSLVGPDDDGREVLWTGSIDRLVLRVAGDHAVAARVLDFKTDRVDPASLPGRVAHYRPQLARYRRAVAERFGIPEAAVEAALVFLATGDVVEVARGLG